MPRFRNNNKVLLSTILFGLDMVMVLSQEVSDSSNTSDTNEDPVPPSNQQSPGYSDNYEDNAWLIFGLGLVAAFGISVLFYILRNRRMDRNIRQIRDEGARANRTSAEFEQVQRQAEAARPHRKRAGSDAAADFPPSMSSSRVRRHNEFCASTRKSERSHREVELAEHHRKKSCKESLRLQVIGYLDNRLTELRGEKTKLLEEAKANLDAELEDNNGENDDDIVKNKKQVDDYIDIVNEEIVYIGEFKNIILNNFNQFVMHINRNELQDYREFQKYKFFTNTISDIQRHKVILGLDDGKSKLTSDAASAEEEQTYDHYVPIAHSIRSPRSRDTVAALASAAGDLDSERTINDEIVLKTMPGMTNR